MKPHRHDTVTLLTAKYAMQTGEIAQKSVPWKRKGNKKGPLSK